MSEGCGGEDGDWNEGSPVGCESEGGGGCEDQDSSEVRGSRVCVTQRVIGNEWRESLSERGECRSEEC